MNHPTVAQTFEEVTRFEKIPTVIMDDAVEASLYVAHEIAALIRRKQREGRQCLLGLATGNTPIRVYAELVRLHKEDNLSFDNVVTFNLDEYYPMKPDSLQSYRRFMQEHLFNHINVRPENIHIPDGTLEPADVISFCRNFDKAISDAGGIDLQILGIGRTGHIGFNEPGSGIASPTRLITLDHLTRTDAASDFYGEDYVPMKAITMGVGSIMKSKRILLMAWGENKASIINKAVEGPITDQVPTSWLQKHPDTQIILDFAASAELTRVKTPWLAGGVTWTDRLIRKAVLWLCAKTEKAVLKLTDRDYIDNAMSDLLTQHGPSNQINIKVFNDLQHTITGWPGGKPNADDTTRPERATPYPKRVLVFSPHPDDDVISMGGTLARLVQQGHQVHTAYQTSGSIAVFDDDVIRYLAFVNQFDEIASLGVEVEKISNDLISLIRNREPGHADADTILKLKAAIRRGEATAACRYVGIPANRVHFLDLPFYETGKVVKKPLSKADVDLVAEIIRELKPHQIYAAGDLSDPHGTHRVCMESILMAIDNVKHEPWFNDCRVWLYRGAWQEWDINQVDMAVPLSPEEVIIKRKAIFKHQSQKDRPLFPGHDSREFWQRAEDRNHATAIAYDKLGMAEYQAIEVFVRYDIQ
ncbi:MAG: glucosamine-6-phosphate deaminase [Bacteroidetes bacterium GWE2_42_24]|nr:MAG: glucosamine-6-phosphate deaminase [Bacteroidetes bacterium GWE2_42_24]OFY30780.1 MAG: glucosamine-6-phosphate deaminase [Bacteroidetes bacterium GWF2_43_11]